MAEVPDELEILVSEVRKTISDNRQFLDKLLDEAEGDVSEDEAEEVSAEEDFEEL